MGELGGTQEGHCAQTFGFRALFVPVSSGFGLCGWKGKAPSHGTARFLPCPSRPRPPSSRSEPAKMGLEAVAARAGPAGQGRVRPGQRQGEKAPLPGENRANSEVWGGGDHAGLRGARGPEGAAERRRAHPALPAEPRPPLPRPRVPFGTDPPAGRGRGRHSHNAPGRAAAAVAAASATASGRRWRKAERRTWTPSVLTSRRCSKPRSGKGTPGRERGRGARGGPRLAESWAGTAGCCRRLVTGADRSGGGRPGSRFWGQRLDRRRGPGIAVGGARPELRGSGGRGSRGSRSSSLRQSRSHFGPFAELECSGSA